VKERERSTHADKKKPHKPKVHLEKNTNAAQKQKSERVTKTHNTRVGSHCFFFLNFSLSGFSLREEEKNTERKKKKKSKNTRTRGASFSSLSFFLKRVLKFFVRVCFRECFELVKFVLRTHFFSSQQQPHDTTHFLSLSCCSNLIPLFHKHTRCLFFSLPKEKRQRNDCVFRKSFCLRVTRACRNTQRNTTQKENKSKKYMSHGLYLHFVFKVTEKKSPQHKHAKKRV